MDAGVSEARVHPNWPAVVLLALVTAGFSVLNPALLIFVPLAFLLLALEPRKPWLMMIAVVLLGTTLTGTAGDVIWWYSRGWALILSAWFVVAVAVLPGSTLMTRAVSAVAGSVASTALLFVANRRGWHQLDWAVDRQLRTAAADIAAYWGQQPLITEKAWAVGMNDAIYRFTDFQISTYPALLAVASLAALALAWFLWRRLTLQERAPLGPLREFRFRDELVWIVVVGAALVALPLQAGPTRAGLNLLVFMAALYAVRGIAVIVALFGSPSFLGGLMAAFLFLMLYPIMVATTLMVGLTDTWLDLRARRLTRQDDEKH